MAVIVDVSSAPHRCARCPPRPPINASLFLSPPPTQKPWFYDLREVWKGYPIQVSPPAPFPPL